MYLRTLNKEFFFLLSCLNDFCCSFSIHLHSCSSKNAVGTEPDTKYWAYFLKFFLHKTHLIITKRCLYKLFHVKNSWSIFTWWYFPTAFNLCTLPVRAWASSNTVLNRHRHSKSFWPAPPATQHIKCLPQNGLFVWSREHGLKNEPQSCDSLPVSPV